MWYNGQDTGNTCAFDALIQYYSIFDLFQTTEDTAKVLQEIGYKCECRGSIHVKGKGDLTTYLVQTKLEKEKSKS